jgi:flagellar FliL protein
MMADQETDEPKKKGGLVKIIGLVLGGLLLVGVGLGAGFFMFGGNGSTPSAEIEQIIERKLKESGQLPEEGDAEGEAEGEEPALNKKETPKIDTFVTSYFEFEATLHPT